MFYINIGIEDGEVAGKITGSDDGTQSDVYVSVPELGDISYLEEDTQDHLYAMQESVNVVVENLK